MGQYFLWYNAEKRQYLSAFDFDWSVKENGYLSVSATNAMFTLLATDWRGTRVILLGDYKALNNETNPLLAYIEKNIGSYPWDDAYEKCERMGPYFKEAEVMKEEIIECEPEDAELYYREPVNYSDSKYFSRDIVFMRYVINHSKKEFYDREAILNRDSDDDWFDPFAFLVIAADNYDKECFGQWIGDCVEVSNDPEYVCQLGYHDVTDIYTYDYFAKYR